MKKIFSPTPLWQNEGIALLRIVTGIFLIYHGWEIFDEEKMKEYVTWDVFKNSTSAPLMVYLGKGAELTAGILWVLGLLTRIASLIVACTFIYIAFFIGNGKIWYEDQHPFLFVLLALTFFFTGPGRWSLDNILFKKQ